MNKPLFELAQIKKLPKHQLLDAKTLYWIKKNIPKNIKNVKYSFIKNVFLKTLSSQIKKLPKTKWYKNHLIAKGIHGKLHAYRVTIYSLILNDLMKLKLEKNLLLIIGLYHDIAREDDRGGPDHGKKSAVWVKRNIKKN